MDKKSNSISPKTRDANGITIVKVAAFAFAIVSWNATADGLSTYIFTESQWMATLISFGIQSILFVLNLRLPFYYHKIGENCPNREKRKYHWGNKKGHEKKTYKSTSFQRAIILFYVMLLSSSSFFSFVYICDYVVYAKYALATAKSALADYNNSQETIIANFLVEMLKPTPDSKVLQDYISKLNNKILDMSKKDNIIKEYSEIVEMTQELTITVNNYISLVEMQSSSTKNSTTSIKTLRKKISTNIAIPSPTEKSFSKDYSVWQNEWHSRLNNLENLIQQLPQLSKGDKKLLDTTVINIDLLENYNINENIETINQLRRNKISDINVVEKATSLLFGKYWFTAWFSLILAVFFDISSLLAGLFIYGIHEKHDKARVS